MIDASEIGKTIADAILRKLVTPGAGGDEKIAKIAAGLSTELLARIRMNRPDIAAQVDAIMSPQSAEDAA
jgi:DNA-binding TFAR19-related protein (PDSD5 family)